MILEEVGKYVSIDDDLGHAAGSVRLWPRHSWSVSQEFFDGLVLRPEVPCSTELVDGARPLFGHQLLKRVPGGGVGVSRRATVPALGPFDRGLLGPQYHLVTLKYTNRNLTV